MYLSYMDFETDVKSYLRFCENPNFSRLRPGVCSHCQHPVLHKHGSYFRDADTLEGIYRIPVFRFRCALPSCRKTSSKLPSFVGPHQRATWDVQEFAVEACEEGQTLEQVVAELTKLGCVDSLWTVLRWKLKWIQILLETEAVFWTLVLSVFPSVRLPVGAGKPSSRFQWFSHLWEQISPLTMKIGVFHGLYRLRQQLPLLSG